MSEKTIGMKFDKGKTEYGLLPPIALKEVADVLTYGSRKYLPNNWKYVEDGHRRYFDAAMRHMWQWKSGEETDEETGYHHLAHAICCLMFIIDTTEKDNTTEQPLQPDITVTYPQQMFTMKTTKTVYK